MSKEIHFKKELNAPVCIINGQRFVIHEQPRILANRETDLIVVEWPLGGAGLELDKDLVFIEGKQFNKGETAECMRALRACVHDLPNKTIHT